MNNNDPELISEPWWDDAQQAMRFDLNLNGKHSKCAISQNVLNDYFKTQDTREFAIDNFHKHYEVVQLIALQLIQNGMSNKDDVFFITSEKCMELNINT